MAAVSNIVVTLAGVVGLIVLVAGQVPVPGRNAARGVRVRLAGALLLLPWPASQGLALVARVARQMDGNPPDNPETVQLITAFVQLVLVFLAAATSLAVIVSATKERDAKLAASGVKGAESFVRRQRRSAMPHQEQQIRVATAKAVQEAARVLRDRNPKDRLFGFALCTDDDVRTLYHVACTLDWVRAKEVSYPDIGYIYVEWSDSAPEGPFNTISKQLAALADHNDSSDEHRAAARNRRFEALVLALQDCRNSGTFDPETLLCVGSTDPSYDLEKLAMRAVEKLNAPNVADQFARALGYQGHRSGL